MTVRLQSTFDYAKHLVALARLVVSYPWIGSFLEAERIAHGVCVRCLGLQMPMNPDFLFQGDDHRKDRLWVITKDGKAHECRIIFQPSGQSHRIYFELIDAMIRQDIQDKDVLALAIHYECNRLIGGLDFYRLDTYSVAEVLEYSRQYRREHPGGFC